MAPLNRFSTKKCSFAALSCIGDFPTGSKLLILPQVENRRYASGGV